MGCRKPEDSSVPLARLSGAPVCRPSIAPIPLPFGLVAFRSTDVAMPSWPIPWRQAGHQMRLREPWRNRGPLLCETSCLLSLGTWPGLAATLRPGTSALLGDTGGGVELNQIRCLVLRKDVLCSSVQSAPHGFKGIHFAAKGPTHGALDLRPHTTARALSFSAPCFGWRLVRMSQ